MTRRHPAIAAATDRTSQMPLEAAPGRTGSTRLILLLWGALAWPAHPAHAQAHTTDPDRCRSIAPIVEQSIVGTLGIAEDRLRPGLRLVEDLGADEQRLADLTMHLEDEFLVVLPDALADGRGVTLGAYVAALEQALKCPADP
jgi:acyl carrier protein